MESDGSLCRVCPGLRRGVKRHAPPGAIAPESGRSARGGQGDPLLTLLGSQTQTSGNDAATGGDRTGGAVEVDALDALRSPARIEPDARILVATLQDEVAILTDAAQREVGFVAVDGTCRRAVWLGERQHSLSAFEAEPHRVRGVPQNDVSNLASASNGEVAVGAIEHDARKGWAAAQDLDRCRIGLELDLGLVRGVSGSGRRPAHHRPRQRRP